MTLDSGILWDGASAPSRLAASRAQRPWTRPLRVRVQLTCTGREHPENGVHCTEELEVVNNLACQSEHVLARTEMAFASCQCLWLHGILRWICEEILAEALDRDWQLRLKPRLQDFS